MPPFSVHQSHATINVGSNTNYAITGDDDLVLVGEDSYVSITGSAITVQASGAADSITIGGDGQFAPDGSDDVVLFQNGGTLDVLAYSRVDANATDTYATLAGDDTFGIYGANDTIVANGPHDALWLGQNGTAASAVDLVNGLTQGTLYELQGSNVVANGSQIAATMTGNDVLTLSGSGDTVYVSGSYNILDLTGGGVAYANNVQQLVVYGDGVTLRGPGIFDAELIGAADRAVLLGAYNNFTIGGNGEGGAIDVVLAPAEAITPVIDVFANSNVRIVGQGSQIVANGGDRVVVIGQGEAISDSAGSNLFVVDGQNNIGANSLFDTAELQTGDILRMRADTKLSANVGGISTPAAATIAMGADDYLSVGPDVRVLVPVAAGHSTLQFDAFDQIVLLAPFASAADLLAHTTDDGNGSIIQFDASGDQLQVNVSKAQVGAYLSQGVIRLG